MPDEAGHQQVICRVLAQLVVQALPAMALSSPDDWRDKAGMLLLDLRNHPMRVLAPFLAPMSNGADVLPTASSKARFADLADAIAATMLLSGQDFALGHLVIPCPPELR